MLPAFFVTLERMVTIMKRFYTAESVTEGHPDKLCDLIADSILDACLKEDENSRVACEVLATKGKIIVAEEITSRYEPQVFEIVKKVLESAGYEAEGIHMDALIHKQSTTLPGRWSDPENEGQGLFLLRADLPAEPGIRASWWDTPAMKHRSSCRCPWFWRTALGGNCLQAAGVVTSWESCRTERHMMTKSLFRVSGTIWDMIMKR